MGRGGGWWWVPVLLGGGNTLTNPTPAQQIPQPNPTPFNLTPAILLLSLSTPPPLIELLEENIAVSTI